MSKINTKKIKQIITNQIPIFMEALRDQVFNLCDGYDEQVKEIEWLAEMIEKAEKVISDMVDATDDWNEAVQKIVGRAAQTGIDLQKAKEFLKLLREES